MASQSPTTAPMSAKDGRSGSEVGRRLHHWPNRWRNVSLAAASRTGRPYGRVAIAVSDFPTAMSFPTN
jgi:hypothetical protein